ncbi:MAG: hypothetical protein HOI23_21805 [Deltaproteobacteria bacterium]|jgi:hypothetical protein|nr:hypothetical protein [Deltaproteobacteria bacterium]MBT6433862.1 hypothetical protein [Deltaproteobacteria bacterium]
MKIEALASHLNLSEQVVQEAGKSLGISSQQDVSTADLQRIRTYLEPIHTFDAAKFDALILATPAPKPELVAPTPGGISTQPGASASSGPSVGRIDMSAFGNLGDNIVSRLARNDLSLKRKTRNCGDTAGMVLGGLRDLSSTQTQREVNLESVLAALSKPAIEHEVWDITVHQHTFTLERHPGGANMLIQSYQPGYNVQHWCGLADPYLDNDALADLPETWFEPSDEKVAQLSERISRLYSSSREVRANVWEELPFNPQDALVDSERMDTLAFSANHITFDAPDSMGATLRGLTKAIDDLS